MWRAPQGSPAGTAAAAAALPAFAGVRFKEKPSAELARQYVDDGSHLWNLGLFSWTARRFLAELTEADPALGAALDGVVDAVLRGDTVGATRVYAEQRAQAVEPLVLERTQRLTVVQASFGWSDLGLLVGRSRCPRRRGRGDADGNVVDGDVVVTSARGCTVIARSGRVVAVAGVDGLVVVDTPDAVLVVPAARSQLVKDVVEQLHRSGRDEVL